MITLIDVYRHDHGDVLPGVIDYLYELMKERDPEINISHRELPTMEQHIAFVTGWPYRFWYIAQADDFQTRNHQQEHPWIGYVSATHANEIGIVLRKGWRGHGFGPEVVKAFMQKHKPLPASASVRNGHWLANIAPANEPSLKMFSKLGFRKIQETFEYPGGDHGKEG